MEAAACELITEFKYSDNQIIKSDYDGPLPEFYFEGQTNGYIDIGLTNHATDCESSELGFYTFTTYADLVADENLECIFSLAITCDLTLYTFINPEGDSAISCDYTI